MRLGTCVAAYALVALGSGVAGADEVFFRFAPPAGTSYVERITRVVEGQTGGKPVPAERTVHETRYSIRKTADGYAVTTEPVGRPDTSGSSMRAGLNMIMANSRLTWHLDPNGTLRGVRGVDQLQNAMEQALASEMPIEEARRFTRTLFALAGGSERLTAQFEQDWRNRLPLGFLAGQRAPVGKPVSRRIPFPLPRNAGDAVVDAVLRVDGPEACGPTRCFHFKMDVKSVDGPISETMTALLQGLFGFVLSEAGLPDVSAALRFSDVKMSGGSSRVLDPDTGLPYRGEDRRIVEAFGEAPETPRFQLRMVETILYEYSGRK